MPKKLVCEESTLTDTYGKFIAEPFERGFGATIANSLRRTLISSIEGAAPTSLKIDGVLHEFSTIPGILEDATQIVLNVKQLVLRSHSRRPKALVVERDKKGAITAGDLESDETVEIINPDLHLCTLTKAGKFRMEVEVSRGRGDGAEGRLALCLEHLAAPSRSVRQLRRPAGRARGRSPGRIGQ